MSDRPVNFTPSGPPETVLDPEPAEAQAALAEALESGTRNDMADVVARWPRYLDAWARLGDAYRVEASFIVWEEADVLQIPASAVFRAGDGWAAFVAEDGRAARRRVDLGQRTGLVAQVLAGIREGERVVVHPDDRLRDGVAVTER